VNVVVDIDFSLTLKPKSLWEEPEGAGRPIDLSNVRKKVANLARYMRLLK